MDDLIIYGGGERALNLLNILPYGSVRAIVDKDPAKQGKCLCGIEICSPEILPYRNSTVIMSFIDRDIERYMEKNGVKCYNSQGYHKNFFLINDEAKKYIDENLLYLFKYDKRLLRMPWNVGAVEYWRDDYLSETNKMLVDAMKTGNTDKIKNILENIYENDVKYPDENFEVRVGMNLIFNIIYDMEIDNICDIGCGRGEFINKLAGIGKRVTGIDSSSARVADIREKSLNAVIGTAENIMFGDGYFSAVTCMECLEHVINPYNVVREIKRVLKKNGYVFVTVPYKKNCESLTHVRHFDENSLYSLFYIDFEILSLLKIPYIYGDVENNLFLLGRKK